MKKLSATPGRRRQPQEPMRVVLHLVKPSPDQRDSVVFVPAKVSRTELEDARRRVAELMARLLDEAEGE